MITQCGLVEVAGTNDDSGQYRLTTPFLKDTTTIVGGSWSTSPTQIYLYVLSPTSWHLYWFLILVHRLRAVSLAIRLLVTRLLSATNIHCKKTEDIRVRRSLDSSHLPQGFKLTQGYGYWRVKNAIHHRRSDITVRLMGYSTHLDRIGCYAWIPEDTSGFTISQQRKRNRRL